MITNQSTAVPIFANKTKLYLVPTIDTEFGDCIDGLVLVDIHQLKPHKAQKYLGFTP